MNRIIPPDSRSSFEIPRICRNGDFKQGIRNPSAARGRSKFNRLDAWGTAEFEGAFEIVEETGARAFQIIDGEVKELNGRIRRDDLEECAESADSKNDPFWDEIWNGMVEQLTREEGAIPEGLGKTGEEIAIARGERLVERNGPIPEGFWRVWEAIKEVRKVRNKLEKAAKKAKGPKKSGSEIEAKKAEERARRKEEREKEPVEKKHARKGGITTNFLILNEVRKNPAAQRVLEFLFPKDEASDIPQPPLGDAMQLLEVLNACAVTAMLLGNIRDPFTHPVMLNIARIKVLTLLRFPEIPDPKIREAFAKSAEKWNQAKQSAS